MKQKIITLGMCPITFRATPFTRYRELLLENHQLDFLKPTICALQSQIPAKSRIFRRHLVTSICQLLFLAATRFSFTKPRPHRIASHSSWQCRPRNSFFTARAFADLHASSSGKGLKPSQIPYGKLQKNPRIQRCLESSRIFRKP